MNTVLKNKKKLFHQLKKNSSFIVLLGILGVLFLGTIAVTYLSRQRQDVRQQASIDDGIVLVTTSLASSSLSINQPAAINFSVNTNSLQVDGVQLIFSVNSSVETGFDFEVIGESGMQLVAKDIQDLGNGEYVFQIITIGEVGQPFSTSADVQFGRLTFTPTQPGNISLSFNQSSSRSTVYKSSPVEDQLRTIPEFSVEVVSTSDPTPEPEEEPAPTETPGSGGESVKQCNEDCSSNAQCAANFLCHENKCRLASNPSSESCQGTPDQGIQRSCNEYCSDNRECSSGLTCYFNRCRNPQNQTNTSCQLPATATPKAQTSITGGTKTPTPKPTATTKASPTATPNNIAQRYVPDPSSDTITSVFGTSPQQSDSTAPTSTPANVLTEIKSPLPTIVPNEEEADTLSRLPQILLIAAIISLPIFFFAPLLISKLATNHPKKVATSGLEHAVTPRSQPVNPPPSSLPQTKSEMSGFAGVNPPPPKSKDS